MRKNAVAIIVHISIDNCYVCLSKVSKCSAIEKADMLPNCTQCGNLSINEAYKLEYGKEPESQRIKRNLL
jgi:hypothetical protein